MMRIVYSLLVSILTGLLFIFPGCGPDDALDPEDVAIQVNEVKISTQEFNDQIKRQAYSDPEMNLGRESRREFVDYLIRKELLIQEAIRLKMDRTDDFIKTIERYWEATLVRRLLDFKTMGLRKRILITEEEMKEYYSQHKDTLGQSYDQAREGIRQVLETERLEAALETWTKQLRDSARISVSPALETGK